MAYINIDTPLLRHRKFKRFKRFLGKDDATAVGYLVSLWANVLELAEDGEITKWTKADIAEYAGFKGDPEKFFKALHLPGIDGSDDGFIDIRDKRIFIHDWWDHAGRYLTTKYKTSNPEKLTYIKSLYSKTDFRPTKDGLKEDKIKENKISKISNIDQEREFERIWVKYPRKIGRKEAERHFKASVKTPEDVKNIHKALEHYKTSKDFCKGYVMHAKTFFNNWRDWVDYKEEMCQKCRDTGKVTSEITGYDAFCDCPAGIRRRSENK